MSLAPGMRLGPYEVLAPIGAGGIGEVYRATDTKLNRDVTIKVLPAEVARDPERLARFKREAQALAFLNHPRRHPTASRKRTASPSSCSNWWKAKTWPSA